MKGGKEGCCPGQFDLPLEENYSQNPSCIRVKNKSLRFVRFTTFRVHEYRFHICIDLIIFSFFIMLYFVTL